MRKCVFALCVLICLFSITAVHAEDGAIKLEMNGEVKPAKDVGTGKGVYFTLPDLDNPDFYIQSIELAVFEKESDESQWHIYTDSAGNETKKILLEEPESLNMQVDFGDLSQYGGEKKYKLGYRYHVQALSDASKTAVAGTDIKDGWRLVGEPDSTQASDNGLAFYKNKTPQIKFDGVIYSKNSVNGKKDVQLTAEELKNTTLPKDGLNGMQLLYTTEDDDGDLIVRYRLETEDGTVISENVTDGYMYCTPQAAKVRLFLSVTDPYGAASEIDAGLFLIDQEKPEVTESFDDKGCVLMGRNLYNRLTIMDDSDVPMNKGEVYAWIYKDGKMVAEQYLTNVGNGKYVLDKTGMADGTYNVAVKIYDKAGNMTEFIFSQTLDSTPPIAEFVTPDENPDVTAFSTWTNQLKKILIRTSDNGAKVKRCYGYCNSNRFSSPTHVIAKPNPTFSFDVSKTLTGKIPYYFYVYDDARLINKTANTISTYMYGNSAYLSTEVWIDKMQPQITIHHSDDGWKNTPYSLMAEFADLPSAAGIDDASGIKTKQYAVMGNDVFPDTWSEYTEPVELTTGNVYYVYFRAVDNAGNETIEKTKVRMNDKSVIGVLTPAEDSMHTIYYSKPGFYVVKNTAYNTRYQFTVQDGDVNDLIKTDIRLVSRDNPKDCTAVSMETPPNGTEEREVIFNLSYLDAEKEKLPDGVYDMYYSVTEVKNSGESIKTHDNIEGCRVVIKRSAPPEPVIYTEDGKVKIDYPAETAAGSLNIYEVMSRCKKEYKAVLDGQMETNVYRNYTGEFDMDNMVVTALYTDIAGNTSTASKRIFKDSDGSDTDFDILTDGNNTVVEESRPANVYYIGIRREKQNGINADIFGFMN